MKRPTLINDVRIYNLSLLAQQIQETNSELAAFIKSQARYIPERYGLKLLELKFESGPGPIFNLYPNFDIPHGSVEPQWQGFCRMWFCGIDVNALSALDEEQCALFFINVIHAMLVSIAKTDDLDISKIDRVRDLMIANGDKLQIVKVCKTIGNWDLEVAFTVAAVSRLILNVKERSSGRKTAIVITELDDCNDAYKLASRISVKKTSICIYPRQTPLGASTLKHYRSRLEKAGFHSDAAAFIEVPWLSVGANSGEIAVTGDLKA
ncbi:MAG: hypothetical protein P4L53_09560 [Candidatus Obscuribacterales bacterium]|nr:hypothetical protein [Candidatus Obscuribacterales bacterium]